MDGKLSQLDKKLRNVPKTAYYKKPTMLWFKYDVPPQISVSL